MAASKSSMDSSFPVVLPEHGATLMSDEEFADFIHQSLRSTSIPAGPATPLGKLDIASENDTKASSAEPSTASSSGKYVDALLSTVAISKEDHLKNQLVQENKMVNEKGGIAHKSTLSPLLDAFIELEKSVEGPRLRELLDNAWREDSLATLKIIFQTRSIHLGKGEHDSFYRCMGWLREHHPETLLVNLRWLVRPVAEKKAQKEEDDEAPVMVERAGEPPRNESDVLYGVSHGYWKDLLNLLVLAVQGKLRDVDDPRQVLHQPNSRERKRRFIEGPVIDAPKPVLDVEAQRKAAKDRKHEEERAQHEQAVHMMGDPFYGALHHTVARQFANQLKSDLRLLEGSKADARKISLAAKWAPSLEGFHDKHTCVASTIAEMLYPRAAVAHPTDSREVYLKRARESYRRLTLSPLRKALEVVERDISAERFEHIKYEKVPSLAMNRYMDLFANKDFDHFNQYMEEVSQGKARISGAVLTPGKLVSQVHEQSTGRHASAKRGLLAASVIDAQWKTLVQRIRDNGKLSNAIAVCDVSGSMCGPRFADGTTPRDTSIGLSLLLADITTPPFGGSFITFSENPVVERVGGATDTRSFHDKVLHMEQSAWGMTTDFLAVFERLLLPTAIQHAIAPAHMVRRVFVFSDMQFDAATDRGAPAWETHVERLRRVYADAGYELPELVFWNLAGGGGRGDGAGAPKTAVMHAKGVAMVSGYSQAMVKMFLEDGQFGAAADKDDEDGLTEVVVEGDEELVEVKKEAKTVDPMAMLWKAIGHRAFGMLKVVD